MSGPAATANAMKEYDLVVIGGGPAGMVGAAIAAGAQRKVALVHSQRELGGAGIKTGTVPSKTLRETALALTGLKARNLFGVELSMKEEVTVGDLLRHEQNIKAGFQAMIAQPSAAAHPDVYFGAGAFVDPHTIRVQASRSGPGRGQTALASAEVLLRADRVLIATGSSPLRPPLFPFGSSEVYDSNTIQYLNLLPEKLAVVGTGVIGCEYACTFAVFGVQVHLIDSREVLLPFLDREVSLALAAAMERAGIILHRNEQVEDCRARGSAGVRLYLVSKASLNVDVVLVAAGRKSNTEHLNLSAAGIVLDEQGTIPVDNEFRTNVPHIYAAGDVIGSPRLASASMEQGRQAARHALGLDLRAGVPPLLPNSIYTIPEVSMVGETEEALKQQGVDYIVGRADYQSNARGRMIGDQQGFLKLLFHRTDLKLLGVHILGEQAAEVVHVGMMAMLSGYTADRLAETCFSAPMLCGLYQSAASDALRRAASAQPATDQ